MTRVFGIFGHPIGHSRSPAMHNRAFAALGIDAAYVPFDVAPERLPAAVAAIHGLNLQGLNVTLPHKTAVMALLDRVEPDALAIGAVNTIFRDGAQLVGMNTDAPGLARALEAVEAPVRSARITVVGAGGAARASVVGLARAGASHVAIAARREAEAERLVSQLSAAVGSTQLTWCPWQPAALAQRFSSSDLVVQATSATLDDGSYAATFAATLPFDRLPRHAAVVDLVYRPRETSVLRAAAQHGLRAIDGLGMLLHQGAIAFEQWTGQPAPIAVMRAALHD
ncbi:MAG: shikimate dehydrogenase [Polyangiales bacterium]